jgi:1,4-dihydroxy-2-naphthoate polyprenyltransferase
MTLSQTNRARAWLLATRPKTLPAAVAPVLVGSAVAFREASFVATAAGIALLCALLIQIATNLANDYFDFIKGADTAERLGPVRVTQSGLIPPRTVRNVMFSVIGTTFLLGLYLVAIAGWPILAIGIASLICAVAYTAGPFPLAYVGLGDLFVFLFFGLAAVTGTHYVQALHWSGTALLAAVPVGALSTAILVVNNYRDTDTDRAARKRTLAVRIGRRATRVEFLALILAAYMVPILQAMKLQAPLLLLPLLTLPLAIPLLRTMHAHTDGPSLNRTLAGTGRLLAAHALCYSAALALS